MPSVNNDHSGELNWYDQLLKQMLLDEMRLGAAIFSKKTNKERGN
jgi:hypothetical protein